MADLATYMTIINNTPYSLGFVNKTDSHGYWDVEPPAAVGVFDSSHTFILKDHAGASSGSEGTTTYQIEMPDVDTTVTFVMKFCDSYSSNNNYCYFKNSHPNLFAVHFQAKISDGDWNNNDCPEGGHPLYLRFFIHTIG